MTTKQLTINLPDEVYARLLHRAARTERSIEDEVIAALEEDDTIPYDWELDLARLRFVDNDAVWRAARTSLTRRAIKRLETLAYKQQREGLSDLELNDQARLVREYERIMLLRATAAAILKRRGVDISDLG